MSVRHESNSSGEYPLIVGHKGGREDEKLIWLNAKNPGPNATALNFNNISGFPTYDKIVGHLKKNKKGKSKPDQKTSPYPDDDVREFIKKHACGVFHGGGHYKEKREGVHHREFDKTYKMSCYSKRGRSSGSRYEASFNTYPLNQLHCPKVEVAFFWRWLKEEHPKMVFDAESFKEYKEQQPAKQPIRRPNNIHQSEDRFSKGAVWKGAAQPGPLTASPAAQPALSATSPVSTGDMAQPGPRTQNPVTTGVPSQMANVTTDSAPVASPSEAPGAERPTGLPKTQSVKVPEHTTSPATGKNDGEDEAMVDQGVVRAHFQSDGMDVQPKEEKKKAVAKGDHHGRETQDGASQATEQMKITATSPKHTVLKANESETGAFSSDKPVPHPAVHFAPSAGTIPDASQSRIRSD